jgi:hypothetical protein
MFSLSPFVTTLFPVLNIPAEYKIPVVDPPVEELFLFGLEVKNAPFIVPEPDIENTQALDEEIDLFEAVENVTRRFES